MDLSISRRGVARARLVGAIIAALIGVVGLVGPASPAGAEELTVTGDLRLVGWFAPVGTVCVDATGLDLDYDGTGTSDVLGDLTAQLAFCAEFVSGLPAPFAVVGGAFTFTTDRGTLTGDVVDGWSPNPLHLVFSVTGGTGDFVGAAGTLEYDAGSDWTEEGFVHEGSFTGTITLPDRPQSPDDCKGEGWRDLVDDAGQPFRNQGECVSWASHHD